MPLGGIRAGVFAKLELLNPMGSVKDRTAKYMVEKAERDGRLKRGATIVDNSSGNTALGLAPIDFPFVSAYIFSIRVLIGGNFSQCLNFNPKEES